VATDNASCSERVFGLSKILGYDFSPRFRDLDDQRFRRATMPGVQPGSSCRTPPAQVRGGVHSAVRLWGRIGVELGGETVPRVNSPSRHDGSPRCVEESCTCGAVRVKPRIDVMRPRGRRRRPAAGC
jgi:hypothetical protein